MKKSQENQNGVLLEAAAEIIVGKNKYEVIFDKNTEFVNIKKGGLGRPFNAGEYRVTGNISKSTILVESIECTKAADPIIGAYAGVWLSAPKPSHEAPKPTYEATKPTKKLVMTQLLREEFNNNGTVLSAVLDSQNRFNNGDWGEISSEQAQQNKALNGGKGSVGRYPIANKPAVLIVDDGSVLSGKFEDEGLFLLKKNIGSTAEEKSKCEGLARKGELKAGISIEECINILTSGK